MQLLLDRGGGQRDILSLRTSETVLLIRLVSSMVGLLHHSCLVLLYFDRLSSIPS
jgi:hypothetical protein